MEENLLASNIILERGTLSSLVQEATKALFACFHVLTLQRFFYHERLSCMQSGQYVLVNERLWVGYTPHQERRGDGTTAEK